MVDEAENETDESEDEDDLQEHEDGAVNFDEADSEYENKAAASISIATALAMGF
ncbi:hypothetical protein MD484_g6982, partial [Candolleomyces efflorescens]